MYESFHTLYYKLRGVVLMTCIATPMIVFSVQKLCELDKKIKEDRRGRLPKNFCRRWDIDKEESNAIFKKTLIAHPIDIHLPTPEEIAKEALPPCPETPEGDKIA